jgi:hypothetical protein
MLDASIRRLMLIVLGGFTQNVFAGENYEEVTMDYIANRATGICGWLQQFKACCRVEFNDSIR